MVGRLRPGATFSDAQGQVNSLAAGLRRRFPIKATANWTIDLEPIVADHYAVLTVSTKLAKMAFGRMGADVKIAA